MRTADSLFSLSGKIVVVTGGSGFLGRRFVPVLAERGARVAVFDIRPSRRNAGPNVREFEADVTDRESLERALGAVKKEWGLPHGLVNAAALDSPPDSPADENGPFERYPAESWEKVLDVNLKGVFLTSQVVGGEMARVGRGSVVNIGSIYGMISPDQRLYAYRSRQGGKFFKPAAYSASKSAILNLTRYLSTYWAPRVRVNTLTFGGVRNGQDARFVRNYEKRVPLRRMARPGELSGALVFLLSEASSYMTGANVVLDGGWTAW